MSNYKLVNPWSRMMCRILWKPTDFEATARAVDSLSKASVERSAEVPAHRGISSQTPVGASHGASALFQQGPLMDHQGNNQGGRSIFPPSYGARIPRGYFHALTECFRIAAVNRISSTEAVSLIGAISTALPIGLFDAEALSDLANSSLREIEADNGLKSTRTETATQALTPAVPIGESITPEYLVCLEDGQRMPTMRRYLRTKYDLTPDEYRTKWNLPADYPMTAPAYSETRREIAKATGLGSKRTKEATETAAQTNQPAQGKLAPKKLFGAAKAAAERKTEVQRVVDEELAAENAARSRASSPRRNRSRDAARRTAEATA